MPIDNLFWIGDLEEPVAAQLAVRRVGDSRSNAVCIAFWLPSRVAARRRVSAADW
jgi:hypothetical protein